MSRQHSNASPGAQLHMHVVNVPNRHVLILVALFVLASCLSPFWLKAGAIFLGGTGGEFLAVGVVPAMFFDAGAATFLVLALFSFTNRHNPYAPEAFWRHLRHAAFVWLLFWVLLFLAPTALATAPMIAVAAALFWFGLVWCLPLVLSFNPEYPQRGDPTDVISPTADQLRLLLLRLVLGIGALALVAPFVAQLLSQVLPCGVKDSLQGVVVPSMWTGALAASLSLIAAMLLAIEYAGTGRNIARAAGTVVGVLAVGVIALPGLAYLIAPGHHVAYPYFGALNAVLLLLVVVLGEQIRSKWTEARRAVAAARDED